MNENRTQTILFKKKPWPKTKAEVEWAHGYLLEIYGETALLNSPEGFAEKLNELELRNPNKSVIKNMKAAWSRKKFRSKLKKKKKVEQNLILSKSNYEELYNIASTLEGKIDNALTEVLGRYKSYQDHLDNEINKLNEEHQKALEDFVSSKKLIDSQNQLIQYKEGLELLWKTLQDRTRDMHTANIKNKNGIPIGNKPSKSLRKEIGDRYTESKQQDLELFSSMTEIKELLETKS